MVSRRDSDIDEEGEEQDHDEDSGHKIVVEEAAKVAHLLFFVLFLSFFLYFLIRGNMEKTMKR